MSNKGVLRIGLSGIALPGAKKTFPVEYQDKTRLAYYASLFSTLEVNSTFYKLPMPSTFEKWASEVAGDFQFTIKLWREVTHAKALAFDPDHIKRFINAADNVGKKKGCLLLQFPASITVDHIAEVQDILDQIHALDKHQTWRIALEFRHTSWYQEEAYRLADKFGCSIVLHDMPKSKPFVLNDKADFVYMRCHGEKGDYKGSYSDEYLKEQSVKIKAWLKQGKDVYVYFNNTMGDAFENAKTLSSYF